jgi:hypothetical protein
MQTISIAGMNAAEKRLLFWIIARFNNAFRVQDIMLKQFVIIIIKEPLD